MLKDLKDLDKMGVYEIVCVISGKRYIGSTTQTLKKRLSHHISMLRSNKHKNKYLQNSYNKYGEDNFKINILEIIDNKEQVLQKEQIYLDEANNLFNINPLASGTPNMSKETIEKRAATMRRKYKDGEIISTFKGRTPWNKGLTKESFDFSYLKVSKKVTDKVIESRKKRSKKLREQSPEILVFKGDDFLGKWSSSKDLEEWSKTEQNNLPIKSRFSGHERMGVPVKVLQVYNINRSCKTGKPYKGLIFKYAE